MKTNSSDTAYRDSLALSRTLLANERTLLSFVRTGMTFIISGVGAHQFIPDGIFIIVVGWTLILTGLFLMIFGALHYSKHVRLLSEANPITIPTKKLNLRRETSYRAI